MDAAASRAWSRPPHLRWRIVLDTWMLVAITCGVVRPATTSHEPPVLRLDEPDTARCRGRGRAGRTVVVSTHRTDALQLPFDGRIEVAEGKVHHR